MGVLDAPEAPRPTQFLLAPASPNPFASGTALNFQLASDGSASLPVFDAGGRLVRTLVDEASLPSGEHRIAWDGRDASGRRLPSGLYFVRLDSGGRYATQKVMVSR